MGEIINATAEVTRVEDHVRTALEKSLVRQGEIAGTATERLGPAVTAMEGASTLRKAARKTASAAWILVLAEDSRADVGIGSVRDAMWNALGRPKQSPHMDEVFPGGVGTYTSGDPRGQPLLMQVLHSRILSASAPQWSEDKRKGWAAEIEALRVPYAAAVEAHRPAEATETVAEVGYRAAVRTGHSRLTSFKRDLKSLGLTETQIHEIIPDAGAGKSSAKAAKAPKEEAKGEGATQDENGAKPT
jgi:hypothetical protein